MRRILWLVVLLFILLAIGAVVALKLFYKINYQAPAKELVITDENVGSFLPIIPVIWTDPAKPMESWPLQDAEIPQEAIKISISANGFSPAFFEANKKTKVVLVLTDTDQWNHILKFKDSALSEIVLTAGKGETRAITFFAPENAGEYEFFCDMPGHQSRGEIGKMIVE